MKLEKLKLNNFLTYSDFTYDFENKPLLVQGQNLTDDGQKSNGSGKSGLQTGIEFCITASNSRGVRDNELVTYGEKEANAELIASCDVRKERIHIQWVIKSKGSNKLVLTKQSFNGEWIEVSFSNVNDGKKWVLNWFDISKEDLFNYYLINKSRFKSFFESSNKEKVDLINRFSDASIIEGIEEVDLGELDNKFREAQNEGIRIQTRIDVKTESLLEEKSRDLKEELEEQVEDIENDINKIKGKIESIKEANESCKEDSYDQVLRIKDCELDLADEQLSLKDVENDILEHNKKVEKIEQDASNASKLVDEFKGLNRLDEKSEIEDEIFALDDEANGLENETIELDKNSVKLGSLIKKLGITLGGSIECPECEHIWLPDGNLNEVSTKMDKAEQVLRDIEKKQKYKKICFNQIREEIKSLRKDISDLEVEEQESLKGKQGLLLNVQSLLAKSNKIEKQSRMIEREKKDIEDGIFAIKQDIAFCNSEIKNNKSKIVHNDEMIALENSAIASLEAKLKTLTVESNEGDISLLEEEISSLEALKKSKLKEESSIGDEIYKLNQWKSIFKNFKLHLANQSLEVIQYHSNRYLKEMGSDLKVVLEGYKTLASGATKDEITAKIVRNTERSFASFSGGEKGRLLFASILANRFMINSTHKYGGLDFLSVDEIFEGVDSAGIKKLMKSIKNLGISVMLITHVSPDEIGEIGDVLVIEKENGISNIRK